MCEKYRLLECAVDASVCWARVGIKLVVKVLALLDWVDLGVWEETFEIWEFRFCCVLWVVLEALQGSELGSLC